MIISASLVALMVTSYTVFSGQQQLLAIRAREYIYIAIGSIIVMFVTQALFFFGVKISNMTTMVPTLQISPRGSLKKLLTLNNSTSGRMNLGTPFSRFAVRTVHIREDASTSLS
jgi:hypothetical protein